MINLNAGRYALSVCVTASLLAGCGNAQSSPTLPLGTSSTHGTTARHWAGSVRHASVTETVIHSFGGQGDGAVPFAGLTYLNGTLYGTTESGGTSNGGTVYSITPSGTETVLYGFMGGQDGAFPRSDLINVNGTFYGTTDEEGACCGTVYSVTPSGSETVLHRFTAQPDGSNPGGLLNVNGTLYGTTYYGGAGPREGRGTVFTITPLGNETVIYTFRSYSQHGGNPGFGPLIKLENKLYGTTNRGGGTGCGGKGCGTVYSLNRSNHVALLHRFQGVSTDGASPFAGLVDVNGTLYGTTETGGTTGCVEYAPGCGTVFSITPSGTETILHAFTGNPDGSQPAPWPLLNVNGTLYGTTEYGGATNNGTIYSITPSGTETVLYSFKGPPDGAFPASDLTYVNGTLYGTTAHGGTFCATASCILGGRSFR